MLEIKGSIEKDIDKCLTYYEPYVLGTTNRLLGNHEEKNDCRQELRIKIWEMYKKEDKKYNSSYVKSRLNYDTINFINRNSGYNWKKLHKPIDLFEGLEDSKAGMIDGLTYCQNIEEETELEDLIIKSKNLMTQKQYESLIVYLSGANGSLIKKYIGTRSKVLTRFYIHLGEAVDIIRKVAEHDDEAPRL